MSAKDASPKGRFVPGTEHPRLLVRGHVGQRHFVMASSVQGSIVACSDTLEYVGQQMKQCRTKYMYLKKIKISPTLSYEHYCGS
jgi:hypothetical protein